MSTVSGSRRLAAETLGTALLLTAVVGSGIMGERLSGGSIGLALLANTLATAATLLTLIWALGPVSGAHFNPVVSLVAALSGGLRRREALAYALAQTAGAFAGVALGDVMFGEPIFSASRHARSGGAQLLSEAVATFGLVGVIVATTRQRPSVTPVAVACWIAGAYWFTASTSFANPAVTLARAATDTFAGIRPADAPGFVAAQVAGGLAASFVFRWLVPDRTGSGA